MVLEIGDSRASIRNDLLLMFVSAIMVRVFVGDQKSLSEKSHDFLDISITYNTKSSVTLLDIMSWGISLLFHGCSLAGFAAMRRTVQWRIRRPWPAHDLWK